MSLILQIFVTRNILVQLKFNLAAPFKIYKVFSLGLSLYARWCHDFFLWCMHALNYPICFQSIHWWSVAHVVCFHNPIGPWWLVVRTFSVTKYISCLSDIIRINVKLRLFYVHDVQILVYSNIPRNKNTVMRSIYFSC